MNNADYCKRFREKKKQLGLVEVRHIFAPPELHKDIKKFASDLTNQRKQDEPTNNIQQDR